ncbi:MAG: pyruvate kinase [bacterium]|nr:pyruvate kinase [bacterium]
MYVQQKRKSQYVKAKIVATIGPSSSDGEMLLKMIRSGMSVARLNFSHGSYEDHAAVVTRIRKLSESEDTPVAILQDLSGPKIRMGRLPKPVPLKENEIIKISIREDSGLPLFTQFKPLVDIVKVGETILVNDGYIELKVTGVERDLVSCRVIVPGLVSSGKGINLPDSEVSIPSFTDKDRKDLEFGFEQKVDLAAMSFVDTAEAITPVREMMARSLETIPVIAKIERPVALKNIDAIIDAYDGIMVARGDLGVEVSPEEVPVIQKKLILKANRKNKLVITATQMLESMIDNPRPTRAEASDVSNALFDGSDAVMLSGETAVGKFPDKAVDMMRRIAQTTEASKLYKTAIGQRVENPTNTEAIVQSAAQIAYDLDAQCIVVFTFTGKTALLMSKYRPHCPVFAFTPQKSVVSKIAAYWGMFPDYIEFTAQTDEMVRKGYEVLTQKKLIKPGDKVITVSGITPMEGATNMLKITTFD